MGGKKQPRTKNNAQPSSSERHAQRLAAEPLVGFSALADLGYVPAAGGGAADHAAAISGQLRAILKKMEKKDAITRSKAVLEFAGLCETLPLEEVTAALPFWPRLYRKLATDVDSRVRELTQLALQRLLGRVRRAAAPHMAQLVPTWLCCLSDPHPPAAAAARRALQSTFPAEEKQAAVARHCCASLFSHVSEGLYELSPQTYSDASAMTADELEARYVRLLTGCLGALREICLLLPEPEEAAADQNLADIVNHSRFCRLAKHNHPQVRRWWFSLVSTLCGRRPRLVATAAPRLAPAVFHALHETDPAVLTDTWDAAVSLAASVPDCWSHVSLRKAVLPQLWAVLREGGRGCAVSLHPLMIVLLSRLPPEMAAADQPDFHRLFFDSLCQGLQVERVLQSRREVAVICRTVCECSLYILREKRCSQPVTEAIVEQLCDLTGAVVEGALVRAAGSVLPALSAGLSALYSVAEAAGPGSPAAVAQQLYWAGLESALLSRHLAADGDDASAASTVDFLLAVASGAAAEPPTDGRAARVTFSDSAPAVSAPADSERLSPLALAADSPPRESAAAAGRRLMAAVRAGAGTGQRRQLVRLLVGVPGVAERAAAGGGPELYQTLMEPELAAGGSQLSGQLLPTVWRLCRPEERDQLAHQVTERGHLSVVADLLELSASGGWPDSVWPGSEQPLAALLAATRSSPTADCPRWQHLLRAVPPLLRCHDHCADSDPAADLLGAAAGGWRLDQLAPLLAPCCRSVDALLAAHGAALAGSDPAALAALQSRLAQLGGPTADAALAAQLREALIAAASQPGSQRRLRALTLAWASLLGAERFCPLLKALLPEGWPADGLRARAQLCLLLRRGVSLRPPGAVAAGPAVRSAASHLRHVLAGLLHQAEAEGPRATVAAAALDHLPHLLAARVMEEAAGELTDRPADPTDQQTAEAQLSQLLAALSDQQQEALRHTVTERAVAGEDGVDAAALALLLRLSEAGLPHLSDTLRDNIELILPCVPLLSEASLLSLVSAAAGGGGGLERLAGAAAALPELVRRRGVDWTLAEAGADLVAALDAAVAARDAGQLPCSWQQAAADWPLMAENTAALRFFAALLEHASGLLERQHWDLLLLAVSSWLAGLQECPESACVPAGPGPGGPVLLHTLCRTVEAVRAAVDRCAEGDPELAAEWRELYSPEWYRALVPAWVALATGEAAGPSAPALLSEALAAVSGAVLAAPAAALQQHCLPPLADPRLEEPHLSAETVTLLSWWRRLLTAPSRTVRLTAWRTMLRFLPQLAEAERSRPLQEDERNDPQLPLPTLFTSITGQTAPLVSALLAGLAAGQTCLVDPDRESYQVVLSHLMTWHLALAFTAQLDTQHRVMTAEALRQDGTLDVLLGQLFCLMPESPEVPEEYAQTDLSFFELEPPLDMTGSGSAAEAQHWACRVYAELLRRLPVLARSWRSGCERQLAQRVQRLTSEHVSPLLLREEFARLQAADTDTDNMTVRARPAVREVCAVYTVEEASTELVVRLPADYPLGAVLADAAGRRVGVAAGQWRLWMLQLTTFLSNQNGSVLDGLLLWKQNIDRRFQGAEECNICFYVLHGSNYQLPRLACRSCRKRFHPACLYRWFSTSSKSSCPMCRQLF